MGLKIKPLHGGSLQVEDDAGHWIIFSLDELRSSAIELNTNMVEGAPKLPEEKANLFVWAAFAAARGYAIEHGLIDDNRLPLRT